jgi:hypothetical protein
MNAKEIRARWLIPAFVAGMAIGGIGGWQLARHGRFAPGAITEINPGTVEAHKSTRPASPAGKFTLSGDSSADFHRVFRMRDAGSRTNVLRNMLATMSPDGIVKLMGDLDQFAEDQEFEDETGGLLAWIASRAMVIEHAAATDPAMVLSGLVAAGGGAGRAEFYTDVMRSWAARDPAAACRYFEQTTLTQDGIDAKPVACALVREWVKMDPDGAFRWLRGLKTDFTDEVAHDALQTLSHYDGVKAGQLLAQNHDLEKAPEFVTAMTAGWARTEPDKAFQWALSLPSNISANGIKTASGAWAEKDFPAALAAISTLHGEQRAAALSGVSSTAGPQHFKEILPMVEALPESGDRASSVASLVNAWVDESPEDASAWLARQATGPSRDQGAFILALKTIHSEPESAMEWAASISSREDRQKGVDGLIEVWLKEDPKAARTWVQQSHRLAEPDRVRLLERTGR